MEVLGEALKVKGEASKESKDDNVGWSNLIHKKLSKPD